MGRARIAPGQEILLKGERWEIQREVDENEWQLEHCATGRYRVETINSLLNHYVSGTLSFLNITDSSTQQKLNNINAFGPNISESKLQSARIRYTYVQELLSEPDTALSEEWLTPRVLSIWKKLRAPDSRSPPHWTTVYRWIQSFKRFNGDARSLIPNTTRTRYGPRPETHQVTEIIKTCVDEFYLNTDRLSQREVLQRVTDRIVAANSLRVEEAALPLPNAYRIRREIADLSAEAVYAARHGRDDARKRFNAVTGALTTNRPLEIAALDHTELDIVVVDDETLLPLGRPTLAICIDDYSRMPLGMYLGFEPPGSVSLAACLKHALLPKTALKNDVPSIQGDWPSYGIMETLLVDNALENHGHMLENAALSMGITIRYAPRRTPWYKGKVERFIREVNEKIAHALPGTTYSNVRDKGDYDSVGNAAIRLSTLRELATIWLVDIYMRERHSALGRSPLAVWHAGVENWPIPLPASPDDLDVFLTRSKRLRLDPRGVMSDNLWYNSADLRRVRSEYGSVISVNVRINDSDLSHVLVEHPRSGVRIRVPAVKRDYAQGLTHWSHKALRNYARSHYGATDDAALARARQTMERLVESDRHNPRLKLRKAAARFAEHGIGDSSAPSAPSRLHETRSLPTDSSDQSQTSGNTECEIDFDDDEKSSSHALKASVENRSLHLEDEDHEP